MSNVPEKNDYLDKAFTTIGFFLSFIGLFFLNNNRKDESNLLILNSILSVFTFIFLLSLLLLFSKRRLKVISKIDVYLMLLMFASALLAYINNGIIIVHWIYLLFFYFSVQYSNYFISKKIIKFFIISSVVSIIIQLAIFDLDGRSVLSYLDPNYSSFVIFLLGVYCFYTYSKLLTVFIFILGGITLSRNYILAVSVFIVLTYVLSLNSNILKRLMLFYVRPIVSFLIITFLPLVISLFVVFNFSASEVQTSTIDNKLSADIIDTSNLHRSLASVKFTTDLIDRPSYYLYGVDLDRYTTDVFINSPHHSFFQIILNYGLIFAIPYIYLFLKVVNYSCYKNPRLLPFYISLSLYLMILGGGMYGIYLVFVSLIFNVKVPPLSGPSRKDKDEIIIIQ